jgi:tellurite resistance protein TerC
MPTKAAPDTAQDARTPGVRDLVVALACVGLGLAFGGLVLLRRGAEPAQQYMAGYLIELSLSVDNVFVFALVFQQFALDPRRQRRLLLWGVAGAIVFRSLLLLAGLKAIALFAWVVPVLGALILATGIRLALARPGRRAFDPSGRAFRFVTRHAPAGLAAFLALESADLVFALDSLPAVIAVTHDAVLAVASNFFAILGLRSLFFVVSGAMRSLRYVHAGLAAVLSFVGLKMLAELWYRIPTGVSLAAITGILALSIGASLVARKPGGA